MLGLFFVAGGRSGKWGASLDSLDAGMGCIGTYIESVPRRIQKVK